MNVVGGVGMGSSLAIQSLVDIRAKLALLQTQLGTGRKSDTYAGMGLDRGLTVGLRSQLSAIGGFYNTIDQVAVRLDIAQTALLQIDNIARSVKTTVLQSPFALAGQNRTGDQNTALIQLEQMLSLLNAQAGERHLFSGRAVDRPAVETMARILDGDGARAGLRQIIDERRQADLGPDGLGRLAVSAPSATTLALAEDVAGSPFGFKLSGIGTNIAGATVSGPAGSPAAVALDLGGATPAPGQTVRFSFALPDGSVRDLTLTATDEDPPGTRAFTIGPDAATTSANLEAALYEALTGFAASELAAASAVAAGDNFFNTSGGNPPQRVAGPPFDNATALIDGTEANTVSWYIGESGLDPARSTAVARADQSLALSYGMRADEDALRIAVQGVAVFASMTYSGADPHAADRYQAVKSRIAAQLVGAPDQQRLTDIQGELAGVQTALATARQRHQQSTLMLEDFLQKIESVPQERVAAEILALQTSLQATLQTTALLLQTNLLRYL